MFGLTKTKNLRVATAKIEQLENSNAQLVRGFSGAAVNRFNQDFIYNAIKTNDDIRANLNVLRTRSRELAKNDTNYRKFLAMSERNIIGHTGIQLQMGAKLKSGEVDKYANDYYEHEYRFFCEVGQCTTDGKLSMRDLDNLNIRTWRIDGEVFLRRILGFPNEAGIAYQILDAAACPTDYNRDLPNGNRIEMGVEFDKWDRPLAYWFRSGPASPGMGFTPVFGPANNAQQMVRIPADEINHIFTTEFPGQVRGFPFGQAAMQTIYTLGGYFYTELVAADAASRKMGFLISPEGGGHGGRGMDKNGNQKSVEVSLEAASLDVVPHGTDFKAFDPQHPAGNFPPFVKEQKRNIANGLDVAYNIFANDLENVNFSSIRAGIIDERDVWLGNQTFYIEHVKIPETRHWLRMQLLTKKSPYNVSAYRRLSRYKFIGRRWPWVDPTKDAQASILQIAQGATSPQAVAANLGTDFDDNIAQTEIAVQKMAPLMEYVEILTKLQNVLDVSPNSDKKTDEAEKTAKGKTDDGEE
jgi:lambda family phage portal protein